MAIDDDINKQEQFNEKLKETAENASFTEDALRSIAETFKVAIEDAFDKLKDLDTVSKKVAVSYERDIVNGIKKLAPNLEKTISLQQKLIEGVDITVEIQKENNRLQASEIAIKQKLEALKKLGLDITDAEKQTLEGIFNAKKEILGLESQMLKESKKNQEISEKVNKQLGFIPQAVGGIDKAFKKLGLPDMGFGKALGETQKLGMEAGKSGKSFNAMSTFSSKLRGNLLKAVSPANLLALGVGLLVDALISTDKLIGELAKGLGKSYEQSLKLTSELTKISNNTEYTLVTTKELANAQLKLGGALGVSKMISGEILSDFSALVKQAGYSEESAIAFGKITLQNGKSIADNTSEFIGQVELMNQENGLALNSKQLAQDIGKISKSTTASYSNNTKELAKAVFAARELGVSLQQVEGISSSLLQFESSITSELEAELLIGRSLNLEKARQFALNNDLAGVAKEISNQIGTSAEFTEMNFIQQQALAKSVGLTRDSLADSLLEREALVRLGKEEGDIAEEYERLKEQGLSREAIATQLGSKKLADQLAANSAQEKFAGTLEKVKEIFVSLAVPILQIVSPIVDLLIPALQGITFILEPVLVMFRGISEILTGSFDTLSGWEMVLGSIGVATLAYIGYQKTILGIEAAKTTWALIQRTIKYSENKGILATTTSLTAQLGVRLGILAAALGTNSAITFGVGAAIAAAAALAGYAMIKSIIPTADDMISTPSGYGDRTLTGPEGSISLNNKDTVVAGTNLFSNNQSSGGKSISIEPLIDRMSAVEDVLIKILNKETGIYLDSNQIGKSMQLSTSRMG